MWIYKIITNKIMGQTFKNEIKSNNNNNKNQIILNCKYKMYLLIFKITT